MNAGFLNHQTVGSVSSSSEFQSLCCCSTAAPLMTCLENSTSNNSRGGFRKSSRASGKKNMLENSLPIWPCHASKVYLKVVHGNPWHFFPFEVPREICGGQKVRSVSKKKRSRRRRRSLEPYSLDLNKTHQIKKFQQVRNVC